MSYRLNALAERLSQEQAGKNSYQGIIAGLYMHQVKPQETPHG